MQLLTDFLNQLEDWIWGPPLLILLFLTGIYLTIKLRGVQFRYLGYAHKLALMKQEGEDGEISHFEALMTALAATIGIGSITGVATAIAIGGVGSLFWMWVAALFGMATKYAEGILAVKYRHDDGKEVRGGPMYYLEKGLKAKKLAIFFAVVGSITAFGTGNMVQANSVAEAAKDLLHIDPLYTGIILAIITAIALFGGIKSIGKISAVLVPMMGVFYIAGGLFIIAQRYELVLPAFASIFKCAFTGQAAAGGFVGSTLMLALQMGISRGVFSSEAGLGSSPIAAAAAKTDVPARQALVSMCSVFITSCIVCTITGLVICLSGVLGSMGSDQGMLNGSVLVLKAFDSIVPRGGLIVTIALIPFAYSTILGWAYYGEKCVEYLLGRKALIPYRICYTLIVVLGCVLSLKLVWSFANIMNGLMAFPNLIALLGLSAVVAKETREFDLLVKKERSKALPQLSID